MYPFTNGSFAPRNGWYVAAHASEIGRGLLARDVLGEPVVMFRREDGAVAAVGGRCPHRHYPLGCGKLEGDTIVCGYHGLAFGTDGRCAAIPSQDFVPSTVRIPTYPLVEHGLWAFIWMGDPDLADESQLPPLAALGLEDPGIIGRALFVDEVKARYQLLNDNLLDLSHVAFLHANNIGTVDDAKAEEVLDARDRFISCRRYTRKTPAPPVHARTGLYSGLVDRVLALDFYLPGLHAGFAKTTFPGDHSERPGELISVVYIYHGITPVSSTTCRYFFAVAMPSEEAIDDMAVHTRQINDEDIFASEQIETMLRKLGQAPTDLLLRADKNAVQGRRMLQAMMDKEATLRRQPGGRGGI